MGETKGRPATSARLAARKVAETIAAGKLVNMKKILTEVGYSKSTATVPHTITNGKAYKEELLSYTERLEKERTRVIAAMENKNLDEEQYRTLADATTKLTHDIQLLSGGKTENVGIDQDRQTLKMIVAEIQTGGTPLIDDGK